MRFLLGCKPELAELGLPPKGYWAVHAKADMRHEILGLDLIPQCDADSPCGRSYARTLWTTASFFRLVFDSWSGSQSEKFKVPIPEI